VSVLDEELAAEDGGVPEPPAALELDDGELGGVLALPDMAPEPEAVPEPEAEPEAEPDGELGLVLEPLDDVAPEPGLDAARSPSVLSQPVSIPAPSAKETATAKAESLICGASVGLG
jgi:hypothetical protein